MELRETIEEKRARYTRRIDEMGEFMPDVDNLSLVVLKLHLVIEEVLYEIVTDLCENPEYLQQARLSFSQLLTVSQMLLHKPDRDLFERFALINKARNKLAHNLDGSDVELVIRDLVARCKVVDECPEDDPASLSELVKFCGFMMLGELNVCGAYSELVKTPGKNA